MLERSINRYYDPATDQFLSIDPLVAQTGQAYVFTNDNPLNAEDAAGLMPGRAQYGDNWANGNLQSEIGRYLGPDVGVRRGSSSSKIIFYDENDPSKEVVYDVPDNYYRVSRVSKSGNDEYFDSKSDTWGTNKQLGDEGLANSHYYNTGDVYSSVGDATQQFGMSSVGDGGDDGGDLGDIGGLPFLVFPNVCTLMTGFCKPPRKST